MTKLTNDLQGLRFNIKNDRDIPLNQRLQQAYHWEQAFCQAQPQQEKHLEKNTLDIAAASPAKKPKPVLTVESARSVDTATFVLQVERNNSGTLAGQAVISAHLLNTHLNTNLNHGVADDNMTGPVVKKDSPIQPSGFKLIKSASNQAHTPINLAQLKHHWAATYCYEQDGMVELAIRVRNNTLSPEKTISQLKQTLQTMGLSLGKLTLNGVLVWEAQRQAVPV